MIQTDDQTLDQLYATYTPPGGAPIQAMPNTLGLIAGKGMTFNRYYVPYPLCCPSRVSLMTGRYAHNHNVRGNVPPNGGYTGFSFRQAYTHNIATWLQGAGYRTIHIGKFLNGYGDEPFDNGTTVPPGWNAWHSVLKADTDHYFYGYTLNNNGVARRAVRRLRQLGHPRIRRTRRLRLPLRAAQRPALPLRDRRLHPHRQRRDAGDPPEGSPSTCSSTTPPRTATSAARPGRSRRPATTTPSAGAPFPHGPSEGFNEGNVNDKPRFIREAAYLSPTESHTYRVYYQKALESLRAIDDGVQQVVDTLGAMHRLRNTYIIFTSDNGFFYGEHRLTGGKFLAYEPSTHLPFLIRGPGIKPGTSTGELAANIDIAPTILELAGAKADKSIDGRSLVPYLLDPSLRTPAADPLRVLRRDQRRRRERRRPGGDAGPLATGTAGGGDSVNARPGRSQRLDRRAAQGLRGNPPRPLQVHRVAGRRERALRHQQGPLRAQQQSPRRQPLPDPRLPAQPADPARDLRRPHLPGSRAEVPADPRAAAQGRQGTARRRTASRTEGTGRKAAHRNSSTGG